MESYGDFAYVYDELMDNTPYELWCERIENLIKTYGISKPVREESMKRADGGSVKVDGSPEAVGGSMKVSPEADAGSLVEGTEGERSGEELLASERDLVVDLGCGTGTLTQLLYSKGYDMIGIDNSEEMLSVAGVKREQSGAEILYLLQDMRELELYSTVGTVISVCDSLNYILNEDELVETFRLVNNYLYPGGIFIFDFNTVYKYEQVIGDTTIAENREDCSFIWENYYYPEEEINEYDLTVFVQEEGNRFRRFTETHYQRGYTAKQMISLVEEAGMKVLLIKDSDTDGPVTETTERICLVAGEQGK